MKAILKRLPGRQALRIIRQLRRQHGANPGAFLLLEAEATIKSGNTSGSEAALEKFELIAVNLDSESRGLVQLARNHLQTSNFYKKVVGVIFKLAGSPLCSLFASFVKGLLNFLGPVMPNEKQYPPNQYWRTCYDT